MSPGFPLPQMELVEAEVPVPENGPAFADLAIRSPRKTPLAVAAEPLVEQGDAENNCNICGILYGSDEDDKLNYPQLGCAHKGCRISIHARCSNIYYKNTEHGFRALGKWAAEHFFCLKHMPRDKALDLAVGLNRMSVYFLSCVFLQFVSVLFYCHINVMSGFYLLNISSVYTPLCCTAGINVKEMQRELQRWVADNGGDSGSVLGRMST